MTMAFGLSWISVECGFAPPLPTGRRTQYYYLYEDGAYKHGYDTGTGAYGQAVASPDNEVQGDYAYHGPDGKVDVKYTAGKAGFLPDSHPNKGGAQVRGAGTSDLHYIGHHASSHDGADEVGAVLDEPGDASYNFAYNVGDQTRQEVSDPEGNIVGSFSYLSKDGSIRKVDYEAGAEKGFIIKGGGTAGATAYTTGGIESAGLSNPDGSYSFSYTAGDHARRESADASGNVVGSFSFIAKDDAVNRQLDYVAGAGKGFIASGNHLPQPMQPIHQQGSSLFHQHSHVVGSSHINQGQLVDQARFNGGYIANTAPATSHHGIDHPAGSTGHEGIDYFGGAAGHHGVGYSAGTMRIPDHHGSAYSVTGGAAPDRAYEFSYNAGDHTRHESSDANGNVVGSFSFIAKDDQVNRQLDYEANAKKGFLAYGNHLPASPSAANTAVSSVYSSAQHQHIHSTGFPQPQAHGVITAVPHSKTVISTHQSTGDGPDGSYSFSYNAGDHSRTESADSRGNVVGSFSFIAKDDGLQRNLDYEAGAEKGFIASGEHLPKDFSALNVATAYSGQPVIVGSGHSVIGDSGHTALQTSLGGGATNYFSHGTSVTTAHKNFPAVMASPNLHSFTSGRHGLDSGDHSDGSYSFSYNVGDHSRQETSDSAGNVLGSFTFVAKDDGVQRTVDYEAGAAKGFIATGAHLPLQPQAIIPEVVSTAITTKHAYTDAQVQRQDDGSYVHDSQGDGHSHLGSYDQQNLSTHSSEEQGDASYSFSYNAGDHTRQESSDAFGNVVGSFSFIAKDDGLNRHVDYEAGAERGFIASGGHLPQLQAGNQPAYTAAQRAGRHQISAARIHTGTDGSYSKVPQATGHSIGSYSGTAGFTGQAKSPAADTNALIKTFLTPNAHHKFGYIYDTKK